MKPAIRILSALALVHGAPVAAEQFCIADGDALQAALSAAEGNGEDDEIRLRGGIYTAPTGAFAAAFAYVSIENFDLVVSGGWNSACTNFSHSTSSILDGEDTRNALFITNNALDAEVRFSVSRLTFRNGRVVGAGGGLSIGSVNDVDNRTDITVQHCLFISNFTETLAGGLYAESQGIMRINNNLFIANEAQMSAGAAYLDSNDGVAYVVNNTVMFNTASSNGGGLFYSGSSTLQLANNILWGNSDMDLWINSPGTHNRYHNNIGALYAPMAGVVTGEITTEPEFQPGLLNFSPRPGGALYNGGDTDPPGGLATTDLPGRPRVDEGEVDIGAYETPVLFRDGFDL